MRSILPKEAEAVVIGGGVVGSSTAYFLARAGKKVVLIDKGYNPEYGARPLRRAIEHYIEDPLSEALLRAEFKDKNLIKIDVLDEEHLKFEGVLIEKPEKAKKDKPIAARSERKK